MNQSPANRPTHRRADLLQWRHAIREAEVHRFPRLLA